MKESINPENLARQFPPAFRKKLRNGTRPTSITIACHGNYNRSAIAQLFLEDALSGIPLLEHIRVSSVGTQRWNETGGPINPFVLEQISGHMKRRAEGIRSRTMTREIRDTTDLFLTVAFAQKDTLQRIHGVDSSICISLPGNLLTSYNELFDPQDFVQEALRSGKKKDVEKARLATRQTLAQMEFVVKEGIVPAICEAAEIDVEDYDL